MPNVWKIAPGEGASHWEMCLRQRCILLGWKKLKDYTVFDDEDEIIVALGGGPGNGKGAAQSIWRFTREVQPLDIVIANNGRSIVEGIGIVTGEYLPAGHPDNPNQTEDLPHARRVQWVISNSVDLGPLFFGIPTVHLVRKAKLDQIRKAYARDFPKLLATFDDIFAGRIVLDGDLTDVDRAAKTMLDEASGQGFASNPLLRRAVELYAMKAATTYFESKKFKWKDCSKNSPYDLECCRGGEVIFCEVKGTCSQGTQIILTNGEVEFARKHKDQMALFIYHSISADKELNLSGGKMKLIMPWDVDAGSSTPIAFTYIPT